MRFQRLLLFPIPFLLLMSCRTLPPIRTAPYVDLDRFMGDWYVVANIPTFLEKGAWNALEHYERLPDGRIATTFTFHQGGPTGPRREYRPVGFVRDGSGNAVWGMRFVWPIQAEYIVIHVDEDYRETIIGRRKRDFVWIMTREPFPDEATIARLIDLAVAEGYDRSRIQRVPHSPDPNQNPSIQ